MQRVFFLKKPWVTNALNRNIILSWSIRVIVSLTFLKLADVSDKCTFQHVCPFEYKGWHGSDNAISMIVLLINTIMALRNINGSYLVHPRCYQ